jgi:hypothetical protein
MMENQKTFDDLYEKELVPEIEKQEGERKAFKKKFLIYLIGSFIVFYSIYSLVVNTYFADQTTTPVFWILIFIFLIPFFVMYNSFRKKFTTTYKNDVIKRIIHHISSDLRYNANGGFPKNQYLSSELFKKKPDRYKAEDYIEGKIGGTYFRFSEVHSEYKTRSGKDNKETWHTIFKGIFFEADFNKEFKTKTFVMPDYLERSLGFIGKKLQSMNFSRPDLIKLEDPEFEKYFAVYGEDQVEARYILSTSLMKRLTEFREKRKHPIAISFVNNSIFVAITEYKNLFEPRIFRTNLNKAIVEEYYSMLDLVIGIVDDLNLNNRIWAGSKMKTEL